MKKLIWLSLCLIFFITSCDEDAVCLVGSGKAYVYELPVESIRKVSLTGPVNLSVTQDSVTSVEVVAEPEMMQELEYSGKQGLLEIGFKGNIGCFETDHGVWVHLTTPDINEVYVSGSSKVVSNGELILDAFTVQIDGKGEISLAGHAETQHIRVSGDGEIRNAEFQSSTTSVDVNGRADIDIAVSKALSIKVQGSATVKYSGSPEINKKVEGSLNLINVD